MGPAKTHFRRYIFLSIFSLKQIQHLQEIPYRSLRNPYNTYYAFAYKNIEIKIIDKQTIFFFCLKTFVRSFIAFKTAVLRPNALHIGSREGYLRHFCFYFDYFDEYT